MEKVFKITLVATKDKVSKSTTLINEISDITNFNIIDKIGIDVFVNPEPIYLTWVNYDLDLGDYLLKASNTFVNTGCPPRTQSFYNIKIGECHDDVFDYENDIMVVVEESVCFLNSWILDVIVKTYKSDGYYVSLNDVTDKIIMEDPLIVTEFGITTDAILSYKRKLSVDDFLNKISTHGIDSLTPIDIKIMKELTNL